MLFLQDRVDYAVQPSDQIVFCPTRMITGQVFKYILNHRGPNWMQGHNGVSKTFSFILYVLLSNYVINFRMKYPNDHEGLQMKVKKAVYWALDVKTFTIKSIY